MPEITWVFYLKSGEWRVAKTYTCILVGVEICVVEIETVLGSGFSGLNILGLPTDVTRDLRERVRSALECIGFAIPARRVVVNIACSKWIKDSRTNLAELDFPVATSILRTLCEDQDKQIKLFAPEKEFLAGELSLSGELKPLQNPLLFESLLYEDGPCPSVSLAPCLEYENPHFEKYRSLKEWFDCRCQLPTSHLPSQKKMQIEKIGQNDFQLNENLLNEANENFLMLSRSLKLCVAIFVAAAGKHHLLVAGEPGVGKSYGLRHFSSFLLPLTEKEKVETKLIHNNTNLEKRPFCSPHHSCTSAALIGGASMRPGQVTLAHHGVLFLDELAEFSRSTLESLREPLDSGCVTLSRASGTIFYPAQFQLCATTNPCPCGFRFSYKKPCLCRTNQIAHYRQKLSGPLLDRFCLLIWLEADQEKNEDIFTNFLRETLKNGKSKEFLQHFFSVQKNWKESQWEKENKPMDVGFTEELSMRGKVKVQRLSKTFESLFPSLVKSPQFHQDLLSYRNFLTLISRKY